MTRKRQLIPLFLALALAAPPLCAQTEQPAPAKPAAAPTASADKKTQAPTASPPSGENAKQRSDSGGNSPFDYRASEEISEDLPVSFPADI